MEGSELFKNVAPTFVEDEAVWGHQQGESETLEYKSIMISFSGALPTNKAYIQPSENHTHNRATQEISQPTLNLISAP